MILERKHAHAVSTLSSSVADPQRSGQVIDQIINLQSRLTTTYTAIARTPTFLKSAPHCKGHGYLMPLVEVDLLASFINCTSAFTSVNIVMTVSNLRLVAMICCCSKNIESACMMQTIYSHIMAKYKEGDSYSIDAALASSAHYNFVHSQTCRHRHSAAQPVLSCFGAYTYCRCRSATDDGTIIATRSPTQRQRSCNQSTRCRYLDRRCRCDNEAATQRSVTMTDDTGTLMTSKIGNSN
jgi:hypothetical protein